MVILSPSDAPRAQWVKDTNDSSARQLEEPKIEELGILFFKSSIITNNADDHYSSNWFRLAYKYKVLLIDFLILVSMVLLLSFFDGQ